MKPYRSRAEWKKLNKKKMLLHQRLVSAFHTNILPKVPEEDPEEVLYEDEKEHEVEEPSEEEPPEEQEKSPIFFQVVVPEEVQPVLETPVESRKKRKQKIRTDEQSSTACNSTYRFLCNFPSWEQRMGPRGPPGPQGPPGTSTVIAYGTVGLASTTVVVSTETYISNFTIPASLSDYVSVGRNDTIPGGGANYLIFNTGFNYLITYGIYANLNNSTGVSGYVTSALRDLGISQVNQFIFLPLSVHQYNVSYPPISYILANPIFLQGTCQYFPTAQNLNFLGVSVSNYLTATTGTTTLTTVGQYSYMNITVLNSI